jgi:hypothetical protein
MKTILGAVMLVLSFISGGCALHITGVNVQGPFVGSSSYLIINNNQGYYLEAEVEGIVYVPVGEAGQTVRIPLPYVIRNTSDPTPSRNVTVKAYDMTSGQKVYVGLATEVVRPEYNRGNITWNITSFQRVAR